MNFKLYFIPLVIVNWLCIAFVARKYFTENQESRLLSGADYDADEYLQFYDPTTAYYLLEKLDVYERPENITGTMEHTYRKNYSKYHFGLTADDQYCTKHRAYFVNHPENVFENVKVLIDYMGYTVIRNSVVREIGEDVQMNIGPYMPEHFKKTELYDIRSDVTAFFCGALFWAREVNKHFSCLTQTSNHIPGHKLLYSKSHLSEAINTYRHLYADRSQCVPDDRYFPRTYVLTNKDQCLEFFTEINSTAYKEAKQERQAIYMRKVGAVLHSSSGIELFHDDEEQKVRELFKNGDLCGVSNTNYIMQTLIDPLLWDGHKFDFRVYLLVASTNPLMAFYHDGVLWVSLHKFNSSSTNKAEFVPNVSFNSDIMKIAKENGTYEGKTVAELKEFSVRFFEDLQDYLYKSGLIHDENWLDNYLRPEIQKAMVHILRLSHAPFLQTSSVYELYGLDFMLDKNLNLWFIEANIFPNLNADTGREKEFLTKMLIDHYEIVNGLLKSRSKRIIKYVNKLIRTGEGSLNGEGFLEKESTASFDNEEVRRVEFKQISSNYFEPEYSPSLKNGFKKIIDFNNHGTERYSGLITEECI